MKTKKREQKKIPVAEPKSRVRACRAKNIYRLTVTGSRSPDFAEGGVLIQAEDVRHALEILAAYCGEAGAEQPQVVSCERALHPLLFLLEN